VNNRAMFPVRKLFKNINHHLEKEKLRVSEVLSSCIFHGRGEREGDLSNRDAHLETLKGLTHHGGLNEGLTQLGGLKRGLFANLT